MYASQNSMFGQDHPAETYPPEPQVQGFEGDLQATGEITADTLAQAAQDGAAWAHNAYEQYVVVPDTEEAINVPQASGKLGWLQREAMDANRDDIVTRGEMRTFTFGTIFGILLGRLLFR